MSVQWVTGGGYAFRNGGSNMLRMTGRTYNGSQVVADCVEHPSGWAVKLRVNDAPVGECLTGRATLGDALGVAVAQMAPLS